MKRLLVLIAAVGALAGVAQAQPSPTPGGLIVKDGNGGSQTLCEYTVSGASLGGCVINWTYNGTAWAPAPADTSGRPSISIPTGADPAEGTVTDQAYNGSGNATIIALLKGIYTANTTGSLPQGNNTIGTVNVAAFPNVQPVSGLVQTYPNFPASGNGSIVCYTGAGSNQNPLIVGGYLTCGTFIPQAGRKFHILLYGTASATCYLERNDGWGWYPITPGPSSGAPTLMFWTYSNTPVFTDWEEDENNVSYRVDCGTNGQANSQGPTNPAAPTGGPYGSFTSGTLNIRFSQ